jgi:hypothetical protein
MSKERAAKISNAQATKQKNTKKLATDPIAAW